MAFQKHQINNIYNPNDDLIVRSIRIFGISYLSMKNEVDVVNAYEAMRNEFLSNGSYPIDFEAELQPANIVHEQLSSTETNQIEKHGVTGDTTYFKKFPFEMKKRKRCNNERTRISQSIIKNRCVFCSNNDEPLEVVKSHSVRDIFGRVLCPKLRTYVCPICNSSGDSAHTVKYCPKKPIITMEEAIMMDKLKCNEIPKYEKFR